jgi:hypothetical protein
MKEMPRSRYFASKMETKLNFGFKSSFLCLHKGSNQITFEECEREKGRKSLFQELKIWAMESLMKSRGSFTP